MTKTLYYFIHPVFIPGEMKALVWNDDCYEYGNGEYFHFVYDDKAVIVPKSNILNILIEEVEE